MKIIIPIKGYTEGCAVSSQVFRILKKYDVILKVSIFADSLNIVEASKETLLFEHELLYYVAYGHRHKFLAEMKLVL